MMGKQGALVVVGSGFVGRAILDAARARGIEVRTAAAPRLAPLPEGTGDREWIRQGEQRDPVAWRGLLEIFTGASCVVNAAGRADPDSHDVEGLRAANVGAALAVAAAAYRAGVARLVHVSSAAVQGERDPLDDTEAQAPFSPYSRSKAEAETRLLGGNVDTPRSTVVYRPTSVQGVGRRTTLSLIRWMSKPIFPVIDAQRPLPLALVESVGDAAVHLATATEAPVIAVHPWEGVTIASALTTLGSGPRQIRIPIGREGLERLLRRVTRTRSAGAVRRLSLLMLGQGVNGRSLPESGWIPSVGPGDYVHLRVAALLGAEQPSS